MLLNILSNVAEVMVEVATGLFSGTTNSNIENNSTYEYWMTLNYEQQESYFKSNEYLKDYITNDYYPNSIELTARHVQQIANNLNREFTNRFNRF
jgi:hypothetical protein